MNEKKFYKIFFITIFLIFIKNLNAQDYKLIDKILVTVEKDVVTQTELKKEIEKKNKNFDLLDKNEKNKLSEFFLNELVKKKLIIQYAELVNVTPSKKEIDLVISNILKTNEISQEVLEEELKKDNSNIFELRDELAYQLTIQKIKDKEIMPYINISDYEVDAKLEENNSYKDISYLISHILVKRENPKSEEVVKKILDKIDVEDFSNLAFSLSEGPNAENYGNLGWKKIDELPSIFKPFVKKAKVGDKSGLIESSNGYHFLKIEKIKNIDKQQPIIVSQYKFQQILIKYNAIRSDDEIKNKLENIKSLINDGLNFSEALKQYSEEQYILDSNKLEWINAENLLPVFRQHLSNYSNDDLIGPFKTDLGWHLVKVYDFRKADITENNQREMIKIELARKKTELRFDDWIDGLIKNSEINYLEK